MPRPSDFPAVRPRRAVQRAVLAFVLTAAASGVVWAQGGPAMVNTETVEEREIAETASVFGQVVADRESVVAARVSGVVSEVMVLPGDQVMTGDILASFDTELLTIELAQAQAEAEVARAGLGVAEARLTLARQGFERADALRDRAAISEGQLEDRQGAFSEARAGRDQAQARVLAAETALARAQYNINNATVRAPFDGVVLSVEADTGGFTQNGGPIAVVLDTGSVEVEANVPARFAGSLTAGVTVAGRLDDGTELELSLRAVLPTEFSATRTRPARFIPAAQEAFSVGQSVTLDIPVTAPRSVLSVPKDALIQSPSGWTVFVNADGKAQPREVSIGTPLGERFEVLSGLAQGDEVVVRGNERLRPMQDIQAVPADTPPGATSN